jgi:hypothetical protein
MRRPLHTIYITWNLWMCNNLYNLETGRTIRATIEMETEHRSQDLQPRVLEIQEIENFRNGYDTAPQNTPNPTETTVKIIGIVRVFRVSVLCKTRYDSWGGEQIVKGPLMPLTKTASRHCLEKLAEGHDVCMGQYFLPSEPQVLNHKYTGLFFSN